MSGVDGHVLLVDRDEPCLNVYDAPGFCDELPYINPRPGERFVMPLPLSNSMSGPWVALSRRPREGGGVVVTVARPARA